MARPSAAVPPLQNWLPYPTASVRSTERDLTAYIIQTEHQHPQHAWPDIRPLVQVPVTNRNVPAKHDLLPVTVFITIT